jgi:hypothetical protein
MINSHPVLDPGKCFGCTQYRTHQSRYMGFEFRGLSEECDQMGVEQIEETLNFYRISQVA